VNVPMYVGRLSLFAATALGLVVVTSSCAEEDIVLARVPQGDGGRKGGDGKRCVETSECRTNDFCGRSTCEDAAGACEPRPVFCEDAAEPVCGCDGITYWNDCLRRASGVASMTRGECRSNALECGGRMPGGPDPGPPVPDPMAACPLGTYCARLLPPPKPGAPPNDGCEPYARGTCWAVPAVCPASGSSDRWIDCGAARAVCQTTCDAIRSGVPHRRAFSCP